MVLSLMNNGITNKVIGYFDICKVIIVLHGYSFLHRIISCPTMIILPNPDFFNTSNTLKKLSSPRGFIIVPNERKRSDLPLQLTCPSPVYPSLQAHV